MDSESAGPFVNSQISDIDEAAIKQLFVEEHIITANEEKEYVSLGGILHTLYST